MLRLPFKQQHGSFCAVCHSFSVKKKKGEKEEEEEKVEMDGGDARIRGFLGLRIAGKHGEI